MKSGKTALTTRMPSALLEELKEKAKEETTTVTELITRFVKRGLSSDSSALETIQARLLGVEEEMKDTKHSVTASFGKLEEKMQKVEQTTELTAKWAARSSTQ